MNATDLEQWRSQQITDRAGASGLNAYRCETCGKYTVTIDVDPGVTPMFTTCRATDGCSGRASSLGYPVGKPPVWATGLLKWEWRIPTDDDFAGHDLDRLAAIRAYADNGGLVLHPWTGRPSAYRPDYPDNDTRSRASARGEDTTS